MEIRHWLAVSLSVVSMFSVTCTSAEAQDASCLSSIRVKDKPVTLNFGSGLPQISSCKKVEAWRTQYYIANKSVIDSAVNGTSAFYLSEIERTLAARRAAIADLEGKIARNETLSAMAIVAKVSFGEYTKYLTLVACVTTAGTGCAVGMVGVVLFHWDIIDGTITKSMFSDWVTQQKAELTRNQTEVDALKARLASIDVRQIKAQIEQNFFGTCQAIKRDCL
jgi:hypothetical protein